MDLTYSIGGHVLRNVSVGGYLKITKGFSEIIAKVDGETVEEERGDGTGYGSRRDRVNRVLNVSLIGFVDRDHVFQRGVRELPLVDNECFLLTESEFDVIHSFVGQGDYPLVIGNLTMEPGQAVRVGINALFASHIGIFGNTGSGKSYTLAKLYHELFASQRDSTAFTANARFVIVDFNGEYVDAPGATVGIPSSSVIAADDMKTQYRLSTHDDGGDKLPVSYESIHSAEFWTVLLDATEKTQAPFLRRALGKSWLDPSKVTAEQIREQIGDVLWNAIRRGDSAQDKGSILGFLDEIAGCLEWNDASALRDYIFQLNAYLSYHSVGRSFVYQDVNTNTQMWANLPASNGYFYQLTIGALKAMSFDLTTLGAVDRIRFKIILRYYREILSGFANQEHLGPLIKRLETRMPDIRRTLTVSDGNVLDKPLAVVSLKDVNIEMKKVIPLLLCRQLYDAKKKQNDPAKYLNLIIDEAHNILSDTSSRESEAWKDYRLETFEEMIKEGRKFGVFLTIASQRPHDISETIISQLHNYFLHRLVNNLDIHAVEKAVSYLDKVSFESLPILPTGTCVLSGVSSQIPVVVDIAKVATQFEPNNRTMTLVDKWKVVAGSGQISSELATVDDPWASSGVDPWASFPEEPPF